MPAQNEMLRDLENRPLVEKIASRVQRRPRKNRPLTTAPLTTRELKQYVENASTPSWAVGQNPGKPGVSLLAIRLSGLGKLLPRVLFFSSLLRCAKRYLRDSLTTRRWKIKHIAVILLPFSANSANDPEYEPVAEGMDGLADQRGSRNLEAAQQSLSLATTNSGRRVREKAEGRIVDFMFAHYTGGPPPKSDC